MQTKKLPIGYWIKQADELLTKGIDEIQSLFGLTRTGWQILNSISEKALVEVSELTDLMRPFADPETVDDILADFENTRLITRTGNNISLTPKGTEFHGACLFKQKEFRQKMMANISGEEYESTIATLQKIVSNLS